MIGWIFGPSKKEKLYDALSRNYLTLKTAFMQLQEDHTKLLVDLRNRDMDKYVMMPARPTSEVLGAIVQICDDAFKLKRAVDPIVVYGQIFALIKKDGT